MKSRHNPASPPHAVRAILLGFLSYGCPETALAQEAKAGGQQKQPGPNKEELSAAPAKVDVKPVARDEEIRKRLQSVLDATGWFTDPQVRVEEGVVFLNGRTETDELKKWGSDLARSTQDAVSYTHLTLPTT